ncbi:Fusaric acid resistance protein-like-domain-containing protein [Crepidotus variabilis]|uniref:Fusaric acid resistance protein-like-domain-containing protein n=1 Tax=Crepidotus variabilis TaxID=179855 RepID=A0A9P6EKS0_9AGAR|nr:Fusaric acid resistance protein-like-domain-containing protein [Crepidotus variabilis]
MENEGHLRRTPSVISRRTLQDSDSDYFFNSFGEHRGVDLIDSQRASSPQEAPDETDQPHADYDSDASSTSSTPTTTGPRPRKRWYQLRPGDVPPVWRNVFKCAIAYLVASMFTFLPYLSSLLADVTSGSSATPSPSGHMVATIAVYFNPAKTVGGMIEADLFCLFGLFYSAFICLTSMSMFWWLEIHPGWEWLADVVAVAWIGLSMSLLAWLKVWMANPSFNTACSMVAIIIFVVIVKEGGLETLIQVSTIVICGSTISNLVCFLIWPQNALSALQDSMVQTFDSFSTILPMTTRVFLLEHETGSHFKDLAKVQKAAEGHQSSFTKLQKNLREAKSEWALTRTGHATTENGQLDDTYLSGRRSYEDTVDCLNRLGQHLNGLRSGTRLQYDLTKAGLNRHRKPFAPQHEQSQVVDEQVIANATTDIYGDLVDELGPPLKALSHASTSTLRRLRNACAQKHNNPKISVMEPHEFSELVDTIEAALIRFESTSNHAVLRLYRRSDINNLSQSTSTLSRDSDAAGIDNDNESVFLVYFFIFTLQEFAKELISLVDAVERVYCYERSLLLHRPIWLKVFFWTRDTFSSVFRRKATEGPYMIPRNRLAQPWFPKIRPHAPDTILTPPRNQLSFIGKVGQTIWSILTRLGERDTKFAIKAGMATALLATPAFIESTRPTFVEYYGDWALISFFVVIAPTIGATNYLGLQRFLGTLFGATVAVVIFSLFPENPVVLSGFGFIFCIPCFYWAVSKPQYLSASRFVLLTYNLTCLFCYNLRQEDIDVLDIGFHRAVAVTAGVLWAAFVSRFWWPSEARRELTRSLSEFCLNLGWLYTRLVASNSFSPEYREEQVAGGTTSTIHLRRIQPTRLSNSVQEFMAMELHLQIKLIELQSLLTQAQHEPRLKGPFPVVLYRQILISLQTILDKLHSMRCVTTREECVREDFIIPVNKERRDMVGNIILSFSTLAASFRLKAPLPPYLPPAEESRLRLVDAIRRLDVVKNRDVKVSRQLLFFAYALTMKGVTMELEFLGRTLQEAFGVIGQSSQDFEMLFLPLAENQEHIEPRDNLGHFGRI